MSVMYFEPFLRLNKTNIFEIAVASSHEQETTLRGGMRNKMHV